MQIRTYRAANFRDAIEQIRADLGPEASVLYTRHIRGGWFSRWWRRQYLEVAAGIADIAEPADVEPEAQPESSDFRTRFRLSVNSDGIDLSADGVSSTRADLAAFARMIDAGVDERTARELLADLPTESTPVDEALARLVAQRLAVTGPLVAGRGTPRVVALVGPTGVGKTTTIAKLAADFRLRAKQRVGLITVDTFRVAAVEQLRTYAEIIDLPLSVVSSTHEVRQAVDSMRDCDLILIDTAGRSPRDTVRLQELRLLLKEAAPDDVLLVLSATAGSDSISAACREFAVLGTTSLVITKLDEAISLGHLLGPLIKYRLPVSYLTDGQNVPDDFAVATREALTAMLLATAATAHRGSTHAA